MIRRRIALTVSATSALLIAAPLLTACGSDDRPGAAAVMDGSRITVSQLQAQVKDVRDAQRDSPQSGQLLASTGQLSQNTLIRMIQSRVIERAGKDNAVTVSRRDVQQARVAGERQAGGAEGLRAMYLQQGIAPGQIDDAIRMGLTQETLRRKLGTEAVNAAFARTSKALRIEVNPRFGKWDNTRGTSVLTEEPWLRVSGNAQQPA